MKPTVLGDINVWTNVSFRNCARSLMQQMRIPGTATCFPILLNIHVQDIGDGSLTVSAGPVTSCTDNCQELDSKLTYL